MVAKLLIILITFQYVINLSYEVENTNSTSKLNQKIINNKIQLETIIINGSNVTYFKEYIIQSGYTKEINLIVNKVNDFGYTIFQMHSYAFDLKLSTDLNFSKKSVQNGQNLGIVIFNNKKVYIKNTLPININYAIAIISYDLNTPVAGGCNLEGDISELPNLIIKTVENHSDMIQVDTPLAAMSIKMDPEQKLCSKSFNNSVLKYVGLYHFLPKADFTKETYFSNIKKFLLPKNVTKIGSVAFKKNNKGPGNRRTFLKIPGVGMIFNTIVLDLNGIPAAYVPSIKYFCNPFVWEEGCNFIFDDATLAFISWLVIISGFIKIICPMNNSGMYCDLVINTFSIGAYYTYRVLIYFNISPSISIPIIIFSAILLTVLVITLIALIGKLILVVYLISMILLSGIIALIAVYRFNDVSTSNAVFYWSTFTITLSLLLFFMFFKTVRVLWLIINSLIAFWYIFYGILFFVKSNLVYIPLMYFYTIQNSDYQYINGQLPPSKTDIWIFVGTIGIVLFGIILKTNDICSRNRNSSINEDDEQRPLISRWTNGSDDVFESPNTNNRLFQ